MKKAAFLDMLIESVFMGMMIMLGVVSINGISNFDYEIIAFTVLVFV